MRCNRTGSASPRKDRTVDDTCFPAISPTATARMLPSPDRAIRKFGYITSVGGNLQAGVDGGPAPPGRPAVARPRVGLLAGLRPGVAFLRRGRGRVHTAEDNCPEPLVVQDAAVDEGQD